MSSVFDILNGATFREDHVDVCMKQDVDLKLRDLYTQQRRLVGVEDDGDRRLGQKSVGQQMQELEAQIQELEDEMSAHVLTFWMRGVAPAEYNILQRTAGKPRTGNQWDQNVGYNIQAFFEKAMERCTYKVTAPDGTEAVFEKEHWKKLFDSINDGQFDELSACVENVNRKVAKAPTSARSSENQNGSEPKQEQPTA